MKQSLLILLIAVISMVNAGTTADGTSGCTVSSDCLNYVAAAPTTGSVCNPCVFGSNLVYVCVNYVTPVVPAGTTYAKFEMNCSVA
tara:strand:+ start:115 stop:372 length:258 start_codon:yes stop_codon:yes gene_type:complete